MVNFLITYNGLILKREPDSIRYRLNNYLISTELCPNWFCFNGYLTKGYAYRESLIYVYQFPRYFRNPFDNYCMQTEYMHELMHELSVITLLPKILIDTSYEYGLHVYDYILVLTYPD